MFHPPPPSNTATDTAGFPAGNASTGPKPQGHWSNHNLYSGQVLPMREFQTLNINNASGTYNDHNNATRPKSSVSPSISSSGVESVLGVPPYYEAWSMKKILQPWDGRIPSWALIHKKPLLLSRDKLVTLIKTQRAKGSVAGQFQNLRSPSQRDQIKDLLENKKLGEKDPSVGWELAAVKELQVVIKRESLLMSVKKDKKTKKESRLTSDRVKQLGEIPLVGEVVDLHNRQHATSQFSQQNSTPRSDLHTLNTDQTKSGAQQQPHSQYPPPLTAPAKTTACPAYAPASQAFTFPTGQPPRPDKVLPSTQGLSSPIPQISQAPPPQASYSTSQAAPPRADGPLPVPGPPLAPHRYPPASIHAPPLATVPAPPSTQPATSAAPAKPVATNSSKLPPVIVDDRDYQSSSRDSYEAVDWDDSEDSEVYESPPSTPSSSAFIPHHTASNRHAAHPALKPGRGSTSTRTGLKPHRRYSTSQHSDEIREINLVRGRGSDGHSAYPFEVGSQNKPRKQSSAMSYTPPQRGRKAHRVDERDAIIAAAKRARRRREPSCEGDSYGNMHVRQGHDAIRRGGKAGHGQRVGNSYT